MMVLWVFIFRRAEKCSISNTTTCLIDKICIKKWYPPKELLLWKPLTHNLFPHFALTPRHHLPRMHWLCLLLFSPFLLANGSFSASFLMYYQKYSNLLIPLGSSRLLFLQFLFPTVQSQSGRKEGGRS